jgi:micrococcal nuclease
MKKYGSALLTFLVFLILVISPIVACSQPAPSSVPPTQPPPVEEAPPQDSQETPRQEQLSSTLVEAKVVRVIDGDTIEVAIGGSLYKVRYTGIDTPETVHPSKPVECFGREASEKNCQLVEGKTVRLEKDVSETDSYGRLLRYVWVGDNFVNDYLVRQGYAYAYTYPPDVKYAEQFVQAQREARENNRGLWVACQETTIQPPPSQPPLPPPTSAISLAIISVTSPVSPGAYATLKARAPPGAQCAITVYYKSGPSKAQGLYSKQADSNGDVSWTWKVGTRTTPGSWRIVVTATYGGKTVSQETSFTVR